MYRSLRDHSVVQVAADSPNEFSGSRMRIPSEMDGGTWYEWVAPWTPAPADLASLAGEYSSVAALEHGVLVIHRRPNDSIPLTPAYQDAFRSSMGVVRFLRDSSGKATELSVSESRVWDMRFRSTAR